MDGSDKAIADGERIRRGDLCLPEPYRAPATAVERAVAGIWERLLKVDRVGLDDDFFDLGGDSLTATEIAAAASEAFGIELPPGQLMSLNTAGLFAAHMDRLAPEAGGRPAAPATELPVNVTLATEGGPGAPIFMIHGQLGLTFPHPGVVRELAGRHRVYYVSAIGFYDDAATPRTLDDTVRAYLATIRAVAPGGPYHVVGLCRGSAIAHEIGRVAAAEGDPALSVTLVDPPLGRMTGRRRLPPWAARLRRRWRSRKERLAHSLRRLAGRARGAAHELAHSERMALLLEEGMDPEMGTPVDLSQFRHDRIARAQMVLDLMFEGARYRPWDGRIGILLSATRKARASAEVLEKISRIEEIRVIQGGHNDIFRACAAETGGHLANLIGKAEASGRG